MPSWVVFGSSWVVFGPSCTFLGHGAISKISKTSGKRRFATFFNWKTTDGRLGATKTSPNHRHYSRIYFRAALENVQKPKEKRFSTFFEGKSMIFKPSWRRLGPSWGDKNLSKPWALYKKLLSGRSRKSTKNHRKNDDFRHYLKESQ